MAGTDLDGIIRKLAKQQHKSLTAAVKAGRDRYLALAGKAKDAAAKQRYRQMARHAMEEGTAATRRLQMSADNAADSYARAMRKATEAAMTPKAAPAKPAAKPKAEGKDVASKAKSDKVKPDKAKSGKAKA
ncbi:MAG: hypothetical protein WBF99_04495 [Xanthobacteraceae bacterium]|nr:hypothetical protein [Hyphomicrobiales bacterium]MBN8984211.1 hypothetical protein [Hyphomicrobiales bacterium]